MNKYLHAKKAFNLLLITKVEPSASLSHLWVTIEVYGGPSNHVFPCSESNLQISKLFSQIQYSSVQLPIAYLVLEKWKKEEEERIY